MLAWAGLGSELPKRTPNERQGSSSGVKVRHRRLIYSFCISLISLQIRRSAATTNSGVGATSLVIFMDTLEDAPISQHTSRSSRPFVWFSCLRVEQISQDHRKMNQVFVLLRRKSTALESQRGQFYLVYRLSIETSSKVHPSILPTLRSIALFRTKLPITPNT